MKKIVYTTDFSENSVAALKYSYELGKMLKTDIIVLHIFDPDELSTAKSTSEKKQIIDHHTSRLEKFCSLNLEQNFEDLDLSVAVVKGTNVSREILGFVRDMDVLMLVMGACGSGTVRELILGSTTKDIISASPFPVLAIPGNFKFSGLKKVIYTTDFEEEDIYHLCRLIRILEPLKVEIIIVHVTETPQSEAHDLMEWFKELLFEKTSYPQMEFKILYSTDVIDSINRCLDEVNADLVVMMEHKSKLALNTVLHRDLVKRMQSCTRVPLMSLKEVH